MEGNVETSAHIGLIGLPGSGKTHLARILDSLSPHHLNPDFGGVFKGIHAVPMRLLLTWHGYRGEPDRTAWGAYHSSVRGRGEGGEIFRPLSMLERHIVIVDALHHADDVELFRENGGMLLALIAPEAVRKERFLNDPYDEKHTASERRLRKRLGAIANNTEDSQQIDIALAAERLKVTATDLAQDDWDLAQDEADKSGLNPWLRTADATIDASVNPAGVVTQAKRAISEFIVSRQVNGLLVDKPPDESYGIVDLHFAKSSSA